MTPHQSLIRSIWQRLRDALLYGRDGNAWQPETRQRLQLRVFEVEAKMKGV